MYKIVSVFTSILVSLLIADIVSATDVVILSNSAEDVEQFQSNQARYLNIDTNLIIFNDIKSEFKLNHLYIPRARELFKMDLSKPSCSINNIKTDERSEKYFFSLPVTLFSTLRLYQKNSDNLLPNILLDELGSVRSLVDLLTLQSDKNIVLVDDIKYPALLQRQIEQLKPKQVLVLNNSNLNGQNVKLIERDRANYIVDYPQVVNDWYSKTGTENNLKSYAIAGLEPLVAGYLMCNESALKSGVLSAINRSILKLYQDGSFYEIYAKYLNKEEVDLINNYLAILLKVSTYNADPS